MPFPLKEGRPPAPAPPATCPDACLARVREALHDRSLSEEEFERLLRAYLRSLFQGEPSAVAEGMHDR